MINGFQKFYLNKFLTEMYHKYYIPYVVTEMAIRPGGGAESRTTTRKGSHVEAHDDDKNFVSDVWHKTGKKVALPKILMVYYNLLGDKAFILPKPEESQNDKNKPFAKIIEKSVEDDDGNIKVKIDFRDSGRYEKHTRVETTANLRQLRSRLAKYGYDMHKHPDALKSIMRRPLKTWERTVKVDKEAPEGATHPFTILPFNFDYHASQEGSYDSKGYDAPTEDKPASLSFKQKMDEEPEFREHILKSAIMAASRATGIKVNHIKGFNYQTIGLAGRKMASLSETDLDDATQRAIHHLGMMASSNPEKLDDHKWVDDQLYSGAMSYISELSKKSNKQTAYGGNDEDKAGTFDDVTGNTKEISDTKIAKQNKGGDDDEGGGYYTQDEPEDQPDDLHKQLAQIKANLKQNLDQNVRKALIRKGMDIEDQLGIHAPPPKPKPKPKMLEPVVTGNYASFGGGDEADADDIARFRRKRYMKAENVEMPFTFEEYIQQKEMAGTSAIYDPKVKQTDFQWEGAPKSMIKKKK
jgi:hypothetical protein